jgi:hypothetical protein
MPRFALTGPTVDPRTNTGPRRPNQEPIANTGLGDALKTVGGIAEQAASYLQDKKDADDKIEINRRRLDWEAKKQTEFRLAENSFFTLDKDGKRRPNPNWDFGIEENLNTSFEEQFGDMDLSAQGRQTLDDLRAQSFGKLGIDIEVTRGRYQDAVAEFTVKDEIETFASSAAASPSSLLRDFEDFKEKQMASVDPRTFKTADLAGQIIEKAGNSGAYAAVQTTLNTGRLSAARKMLSDYGELLTAKQRLALESHLDVASRTMQNKNTQRELLKFQNSRKWLDEIGYPVPKLESYDAKEFVAVFNSLKTAKDSFDLPKMPPALNNRQLLEFTQRLDGLPPNERAETLGAIAQDLNAIPGGFDWFADTLVGSENGTTRENSQLLFELSISGDGPAGSQAAALSMEGTKLLKDGVVKAPDLAAFNTKIVESVGTETLNLATTEWRTGLAKTIRSQYAALASQAGVETTAGDLDSELFDKAIYLTMGPEISIFGSRVASFHDSTGKWVEEDRFSELTQVLRDPDMREKIGTMYDRYDREIKLNRNERIPFGFSFVRESGGTYFVTFRGQPVKNKEGGLFTVDLKALDAEGYKPRDTNLQKTSVFGEPGGSGLRR